MRRWLASFAVALFFATGTVALCQQAPTASTDEQKALIAGIKTAFQAGLGEFKQKNWAAAEQHLRTARDLSTKLFGPNDKTTLELGEILAIAIGHQDRHAEAEEMAMAVYEARLRVLPANDPQTFRVLEFIANERIIEVNCAAAVPLIAKLLDYQRGRTEALNKDQWVIRASWGACLEVMGQHAEAERLVQDAYDQLVRLTGEGSGETMLALAAKAAVLKGLGRFADAEAAGRKAYEGRVRLYGPDDRIAIKTLSDVAIDIAIQGRSPEAETLARQNYETAKRVFGANSADARIVLEHLVKVLQYGGHYSEAEHYAQQLTAPAAQNTPANTAMELHGRQTAAMVALQQERAEDALAQFRTLYDTEKRVLGPDNRETLTTLVGYFYSLVRLEQFAAAEALAEPNIDAIRKSLGRDHPDTGMALALYAVVKFINHKDESGERAIRDIYEGNVRTFGPEHAYTLSTLEILSLMHLGQKQYALSEKEMAQVAAGFEHRYGASHQESITSLAFLGQVRVESFKRVAEGYVNLKAAADAVRANAKEAVQRRTGPSELQTVDRLRIAREIYLTNKEIFDAQIDAGWALAHRQ